MSPKGKLGDGQQLILSWNYDFCYPPNGSRDEIYTFDDKQGLVRLTQNPGHGYLTCHPSPDGKYMIIEDTHGHMSQLITIERDGSQTTERFTNFGIAQAKWSPNSAYFAYLSPRLYIYELRGHRYLPIPDDLRVKTFICTSFICTSDGNLLIAYREAEQGIRLIRMTPAGEITADLGPLAFLPGKYPLLWLSPDGTRVAYEMRTEILDNTQSDRAMYAALYIAKIDGSERQMAGKMYFDQISWSPDGQHVAFVEPSDPTDMENGERLIVFDIDGTRHELIDLNDGDPSGDISTNIAWSPDSQQLAVTSYLEFMNPDEPDDVPDAGSALFAMNFDGTNLRQIHEPNGLIFDIKWRMITTD